MTKTKNTLDDLRDHLFETLESLKPSDDDKEETEQSLKLKIERAKAITQVAGTIIDAAKTQVAFHEITGSEPAAATARFFGRLEEGKPNGQNLLTERIEANPNPRKGRVV